jgi:serine/threonine-protein kinase
MVAMAYLIGQSLGRYHILAQVGEGGMAVVYKAYDTRMETDVAVKIIRTENLTLGTMDRTLKRFEREAKSLARLTHPNIVKVMDYGEFEGQPYLVMPYLPGGTLKAMLGKPIPWQEAINILIPIAHALGYAHEHNIIHRDIKPANILITEKGQPMLSDFGVAKLLDAEETMELTGSAVGIGTPEYMAPEQGNSKTIDHRADIYSLGVVFYEMVTGRKPYVADTPLAVLIKRASEPLPRPGKFVPGLPQTVENVLLKVLAKEPKDRYQSMGDFVHALEGLTAGRAFSKAKAKEKKIHEQRSEVTLPAIPRKIWISIGLAGLVIGLFAVLSKPLSALTAQVVATSTPSSAPTSTNSPTPVSTSRPIFTNTPTFTDTPEATTTSEFSIGSTMIGDDGMILVFVPAGEFTMGSEVNSAEKPIHIVTLKAFWIDQTEVTNARYAKCVDAGICKPPILTFDFDNSDYANHPVVYVNWDKAKTYCLWAGRDLPTEAQWEKAARGTGAFTYPWSNETPNKTLLNYNSNIGGTSKVASYKSGRNPYRAYDMAGNVWEWVNDWYSDTYYQSSPTSNPTGPDSGQYRILRGGSWGSIDLNVRSAFRGRYDPSRDMDDIGFRCARSLP